MKTCSCTGLSPATSPLVATASGTRNGWTGRVTSTLSLGGGGVVAPGEAVGRGGRVTPTLWLGGVGFVPRGEPMARAVIWKTTLLVLLTATLQWNAASPPAGMSNRCAADGPPST